MVKKVTSPADSIDPGITTCSHCIDEAVVLQYLMMNNRPYSACTVLYDNLADIYNNLHEELVKPP